MKDSPSNSPASSPQQQHRPPLKRSPEPDLYLPAMPPLWLIDHLRHYAGRLWRAVTHRSRWWLSILLVVIIGCDGSGIKSDDCPAARVAEWSGDIQPRYQRLMTSYRHLQCDRGRDNADKCERLKSQLTSLLNEIDGYLTLDKNREQCTRAAKGLNPLPDKLRSDLKAIREALRKTVKHSQPVHWTPREDFCRVC